MWVAHTKVFRPSAVIPFRVATFGHRAKAGLPPVFVAIIWSHCLPMFMFHAVKRALIFDSLNIHVIMQLAL